MGGQKGTHSIEFGGLRFSRAARTWPQPITDAGHCGVGHPVQRQHRSNHGVLGREQGGRGRIRRARGGVPIFALGFPSPCSWCAFLQPNPPPPHPDTHTQDVAVCLVLCEAVYKAADVDTGAATAALCRLAAAFPAGVVPPLSLAWTRPTAPQAYLVVDCPTTNALYVAFRGTKRRADLGTLSDVAPAPAWPRRHAPGGAAAAAPPPPRRRPPRVCAPGGGGAGGGVGGARGGKGAAPGAHRPLAGGGGRPAGGAAVAGGRGGVGVDARRARRRRRAAAAAVSVRPARRRPGRRPRRRVCVHAGWRAQHQETVRGCGRPRVCADVCHARRRGRAPRGRRGPPGLWHPLPQLQHPRGRGAHAVDAAGRVAAREAGGRHARRPRHPPPRTKTRRPPPSPPPQCVARRPPCSPPPCPPRARWRPRRRGRRRWTWRGRGVRRGAATGGGGRPCRRRWRRCRRRHHVWWWRPP